MPVVRAVLEGEPSKGAGGGIPGTSIHQPAQAVTARIFGSLVDVCSVPYTIVGLLLAQVLGSFQCQEPVFPPDVARATLWEETSLLPPFALLAFFIAGSRSRGIPDTDPA
jgi:hypothetical protein